MSNRSYYLNRDENNNPQLEVANERQKLKKYSSIVEARRKLGDINDGEVIATEDSDISLANAWIGTQEQYDAAPDLPKDTICFIVDNGDSEYSTKEVSTHKSWVNNKTIYRKVLTGLTWGPEWDYTSSYKFDDLNADTIISAQFLTKSTCNECVQLHKDPEGTYELKSSEFSTTNGTCIVEYTKVGE